MEPRRRAQVFALVLAGVFGAVAVISWWTGRDNPREGSSIISEGGPPIALGDVPKTYRAVYRVEDRSGTDLVVNTEKTWFRRPFDSRVEIFRGPPPGGERLSVRQSAFGVLTSTGPRSKPLNISAPPSIASGDLRIDAPLKEAVDERLVLRRERRDVFGRRCQVYRTGGPVFAGELTRYEPGRGDYADVCIDAAGLVLEEVWYAKGKLLRRRVAVEVELDRKLSSSLFEISVPVQPGIERGSVERIPQEGGRPLWVFERLPRGYDELGLYRVAIAPSAAPRLGPSGPSLAPVSRTSVYVRGPDLLVVDQDPSLASVTSRESRERHRVEVPGFADAVLIFDARMSEFRGEDDDGSIVRVYGTLSPSELLGYARTLRRGSS